MCGEITTTGALTIIRALIRGFARRYVSIDARAGPHRALAAPTYLTLGYAEKTPRRLQSLL